MTDVKDLIQENIKLKESKDGKTVEAYNRIGEQLERSQKALGLSKTLQKSTTSLLRPGGGMNIDAKGFDTFGV